MNLQRLTIEQLGSARAFGLLSPDEYLTELCRRDQEAAQRKDRIMTGKAPETTH